MPDWVSHIGTAYLGGRFAGIIEIQFVLLGAVLPDVVMPVFVAVDLWHYPLSHYEFAYLLAFQSLFIVSLLAAGLAMLHAYKFRCFLLIFVGALSHFILDVLETDIDCGLRIFYPFSYWSWSPGLLKPGEPLTAALLGISTLAIVFALIQSGLKPIHLQLQRRNVSCAVILVSAAIVFPLTTRKTIIVNNVHSLSFLGDPVAWKNRTVDLCFTEVIGSNPVVVRELGTNFELASSDNLTIGEIISVRGVYREGKIYPSRLYKHKGFSDAWISLAGLVALLCLFISGRVKLAH